MTKQFLSIIAFFLAFLSNSLCCQEISDHTIGLRLSESDGFWVEGSYQFKVTSNTRGELDLGVQGRRYFNALKSTGIYQWVFRINDDFNWFVGPGIGGGLVDSDTNLKREKSGTFGFVVGDIGIEYRFNFPLQVAADFRQEIYFDSYNDKDINFNLGLCARYRFN